MLMLSGMVKMILNPRAAQTIASAMPVLPEVASTIVPPGFRAPDSVAASTIAIARRSFTDEDGL